MIVVVIRDARRGRGVEEGGIFCDCRAVGHFALRLAQPLVIDVAGNAIEIRDAVGKGGTRQPGATASHAQHRFHCQVVGVAAAASGKKVHELALDVLEPVFRIGVAVRPLFVRTCRVEEVEEGVP